MNFGPTCIWFLNKCSCKGVILYHHDSGIADSMTSFNGCVPLTNALSFCSSSGAAATQSSSKQSCTTYFYCIEKSGALPCWPNLLNFKMHFTTNCRHYLDIGVLWTTFIWTRQDGRTSAWWEQENGNEASNHPEQLSLVWILNFFSRDMCFSPLASCLFYNKGATAAQGRERGYGMGSLKK